MSEVIRIGNLDIAVGLEWSDLPPEMARTKAISKVGRSRKARLFGQLPDETGNVGFLIKPPKGKAKKLVSLALTCFGNPEAVSEGDDYRTALIAMWDLSPEQTALVIVLHGNVFRDLVVSPFDAAREVRDFLANIGHDPYKVVGQSEHAPTDVGNIRTVPLEEWLRAVDTAQCQLKPLPVPELRLILGIGALALMVGGGAMYRQHAKAEEARLQAERERLSNPNFIYERDIENSLALAGAPVRVAAPKLGEILDSIPLTVGRWFFNGVKCTLATGQCEVAYARRVRGGLNTDFERTKPGYFSAVKYPVSGGVLIATLPIAKLMPPLNRARNEPRPTLAQLRIEVGSVLQAIGRVPFGQDFLKAEWQGEPAIFGAPGGVDVNRIENPIFAMAWRVTSPRMWGRDSLMAFPDNCALTEVSVGVQMKGSEDDAVPSFNPLNVEMPIVATGVCYANR